MIEDKTQREIHTEEEVRRNALPVRKEVLKILQGRRETLLYELTETEALLQGTLLFETEEEDCIRISQRHLQRSISRLDKALTLLEENIRRVEEGYNL